MNPFSNGANGTMAETITASGQSNWTTTVRNWTLATQDNWMSLPVNSTMYPETNPTPTNWTTSRTNWTSNLANWTSTATDLNMTKENWTPGTEWLLMLTNLTSTQPNLSSMHNFTNGSWFYDSDNWTSTQATWVSTDTTWSSTSDEWMTAAPEVQYTVPMAVLYLYFSLRVLWALLTIIGNTMTIFVVARFEVFHTSSNYLICSLAVADLISVPGVPLTIIHQTYPDSTYFVSVCLIEQTINILSIAGSLVNIMYISLDRYIYIAFPFRYPSLITSSRTLGLISFTWACYMVSTPLTMYFGSHLTLGMTCKFSVFLIPAVYRLYMTPQFLIFLFLTIGFNLAIAKIAYKQTRAIAAAQQSYNTVEASVSRRTRKISRMLMTLLGAYILCTIPQYVMALIIHRRVTVMLLSIEKLTTLFYWAGTWVNPILYVWRLKQFRVAFKKVLTGHGNLHDYADAN